MVEAAHDVGEMSYEAYLALDRASPTKHEYVNGRAYAMAGGTPEHARLAGRLLRLLGIALEGRGCEAFNSDLRVRIEATGRSTYPDVAVVCRKLERAQDDPDAITNPSLIAEVLSSTTEADDRGSKWSHYRRIPSLQHYVLVAQDERRVEVYTRDADAWRYQAYESGEVALAALGMSISVDAIYRSALG